MAQEEVQYPLDPEKVYFSMDELTLDTDEGPKTLRMGAWLNYDPVRIHRMIIRDKVLQVDTMEVLNPLVSKLRRADPDYYKKFMGLRLVIDYPGYSSGILAKIPFENDPVGSTNGGERASTRTRCTSRSETRSSSSRKSR